jgi:hypothetical protein
MPSGPSLRHSLRLISFATWYRYWNRTAYYSIVVKISLNSSLKEIGARQSWIFPSDVSKTRGELNR